ncbi:MAG: hypothetical protein HYX38_36300 [Rhodospirillales bacterium]|nr:hypothetical protein [Rhodospirillales bacterium]
MNGAVRFSKVVRLRFGQFLRGKSLVQFICVLAVAMASILHVDASFASSPAECAVVSVSQDDDQGTDQIASEPCHFCSVTAFANLAAPAVVDAGSAPVPHLRSRQLIAFERPATAPPPKA